MAAKINLPHKDIVIKWKEEKVIKWLKRVSYFLFYNDALYIFIYRCIQTSYYYYFIKFAINC